MTSGSGIRRDHSTSGHPEPPMFGILPDEIFDRDCANFAKLPKNSRESSPGTLYNYTELGHTAPPPR